MHQRYRRTDGQTDTGRQQIPRLRIVSRGKKRHYYLLNKLLKYQTGFNNFWCTTYWRDFTTESYTLTLSHVNCCLAISGSIKSDFQQYWTVISIKSFKTLQQYSSSQNGKICAQIEAFNPLIQNALLECSPSLKQMLQLS